jgi:PST family polysaccharide transporter
MVLARLLTPAEFGLVAISQSLLGLLALVSVEGVGAALLRRRDSIQAPASTYFWLSAGWGVVLVAVIQIAALPLASLMGAPDAAPLIRALSLSFLFGTMATVPMAILSRDLRFSVISAQAVAAAACYFVVEIVLALLGFGAWAVIIGQVASTALALLIALVAAKWIPSFRFSWRVVRADGHVLGGLGVARVFGYLQKNVDFWAVSRQLGSSQLGIYYVAYVLPNILRLRATDAFRTVMMPLLARQGDGAAAADIWRRSTTVFLALAIPALVGMAAVAGPAVEVFFGSQWNAAVLPMQILTLGAIVELYSGAVGSAAVVRGSMASYTSVIVIRGLATAALVGLAVGLGGGLPSVALAVVLAAAITVIPQELLIARPISIGITGLTRPIWVSATLSAAMFAATAATLGLLVPPSAPALVSLSIGVGVGAATYLGLGFVFARPTVRVLLKEAGLVAGIRWRNG